MVKKEGKVVVEAEVEGKVEVLPLLVLRLLVLPLHNYQRILTAIVTFCDTKIYEMHLKRTAKKRNNTTLSTV